jgi:hypothetical protein
MLRVMKRFGYPDFLLATSDELVDGQYADRLQLRPVCDRLWDIAPTSDPPSRSRFKENLCLTGHDTGK